MPRVVVLGSSGYDLTIRLPRLPRPGETLLAGDLLTGLGGKGANQAIAARRSGAEVSFFTAFGDDDFGRRARQNLESEEIELTHAKVVAGSANQVALIFVGETDGQNLIGVAPGASALLSPEDVEQLPLDVFQKGRVMLAALEIRPETVEAGLRRAKKAGMITILNPAPVDLKAIEILKFVDVITPNETEMSALANMEIPELNDALGAARNLIAKGVGAVVLTRGARGCVVVDETRGAWSIDGHRVKAIDTVGAGDAFNGALAASLSEGLSLLDAARRANAAGALAVLKPGAQGGLPSRLQIDVLLEEEPIKPKRLDC